MYFLKPGENLPKTFGNPVDNTLYPCLIFLMKMSNESFSEINLDKPAFQSKYVHLLSFDVLLLLYITFTLVEIKN